MLNRPHLIIAGQFPPPVNGFAYITQKMAEVLSTGHETTIIDLAPHKPKNGPGYHLRRLALTIKGIFPLLRGSLRADRRFYIACEGKLGLVYTLILCTAARAFRFPTYIHHHSFGYIENSSRLVACLLRVIGRQATHIFLCPVMAQLFSDRYQWPVRSLVLSNSAFVDMLPSETRIWQEEKALTIGLLSNLNTEKGLGLFLDVLHAAKSEGLNINGILAGPPVSDSDRDLITAARGKLGGRLDYRGPVYGGDKAEFYRSIDVFLFPTRYANEAQPTVVFEAMAHGVPVLSYDRGCIRGQVEACGAILERDGDFIPFALAWLRKHLADPALLEGLKVGTKTAFLNDREQAKQTLAMLFATEYSVVQPSPSRGPAQ
jgi:glycosyltransferase involved in cell wall biosynthesis